MNFIESFHLEHSEGCALQLKSVQALRGIAAILVMLSHLHGVENRYSEGSPILSSAWLAGVSGVDLFFVISGFIMVWVAGDMRAGWRSSAEFMFARITRIYPVWWLFLGLMCFYLLFSYGVPWDSEALTQQGISGVEHLFKSIFLIPHDAFPVLQLGWTLIHEMCFYLVFALILLLPQKHRVPAYFVWALVIFASISAQITGFYADSLFSVALFPMSLEFLMGVAVGLALKNHQHAYRVPALAAGLIWLIVAVLTVDFSNLTNALATQRTFAFGPAFALIIYALVAMEQKNENTRFISGSLVRLGDWSYSLYLSHILIISTCARVFFPIFGGPGPIDNIAFLFLASASAIMFSGLSYTLFEQRVARAAHVLRQRYFPKDSIGRAPV
ncbi:MAG: acyltransferase [Henriciella sp.]